MKHIDWKATARRSLLQTRVFEPAVSLNVLIALNATTGEFAWQGSNRRLFERAVTVAASVAGYCAAAGYSFGLLSNGVAVYSGKGLSVALGRSRQQLGLILEALAMAGPYSVITVADVLQRERAALPPGATVVLVTAIVTRALAAEIAVFQTRGYRVIVLYAGDGGPEIRLAGVTIHSLGRVLETLERETAADYESVLAD